MAHKEDRGAYLGALFMQRNPAQEPATVARDVADLRRDARALDALGVHACNYGLSDRQEARRDKIAANVRCIAAGYSLDAETSGDPRGYVVKLFAPENSRAGDGWGGGWGVY